MANQKRVAAIHDISGVGRCSLTVALPILSAAGIETSVMPTAVLSTHTGGFTGYTYRDLTMDMLPMAKHWKSLGIKFNAMYSGFLGSFEQLKIVSEIFDIFKDKGNLIMVDPVMADSGKYYSIFNNDFAPGMAGLCKKADIIVPNITEAMFLLGMEYRDGPYEVSFIENLLKRLSALGPKNVVLTGVWFEPAKLGAACYNAETGDINFEMNERVEGFFHGTGDIFGSVLLAGVLCGKTLAEAAKLAVDFTLGCIKKTDGTDFRYGVNFEAEIPWLIKSLGLI